MDNEYKGFYKYDRENKGPVNFGTCAKINYGPLQKKERRMRNMLYDILMEKIPDYYPTMYRDGFTPEQILMAKRRQMLEEQEEREVLVRKRVLPHNGTKPQGNDRPST